MASEGEQGSRWNQLEAKFNDDINTADNEQVNEAQLDPPKERRISMIYVSILEKTPHRRDLHTYKSIIIHWRIQVECAKVKAEIEIGENSSEIIIQTYVCTIYDAYFS